MASSVAPPSPPRRIDVRLANPAPAEDRVVFVTGGAGTICSMQTRALVRLGADACIVGRSEDKTVDAAKDIAAARPGARVIGIGGCDVRQVRRRLGPLSHGPRRDRGGRLTWDARRWKASRLRRIAVRVSWEASTLSCEWPPPPR